MEEKIIDVEVKEQEMKPGWFTRNKGKVMVACGIVTAAVAGFVTGYGTGKCVPNLGAIKVNAKPLVDATLKAAE